MAVNFGLLQPVDVGGAFTAGFERGRVQSALGALANDPANPRATAVLAQFNPELAMRFQEHGRQQQYRGSVRAALSPQTGEVDPVAMGTAIAEHGSPEDIMRWQTTRSTVAENEREAAAEAREQLARLAAGASPQNWGATRQAAIQMGVPADRIPEQFDPQWLEQQRAILRATGDQQEMTGFMREFEAAGYDINSPEGQAAFRRMMENRYAAPPRFVTDANGQVHLVTPSALAETPPVLTDEDIRRMEQQGGPAPAAGPATFPGQR